MDKKKQERDEMLQAYGDPMGELWGTEADLDN